MPHIFDPFFTTKGVGEGTGLGLAVTYALVQRMNGKITVESEPGLGSVFTLTLPVTDRTSQGPGRSPNGELSRIGINGLLRATGE